MSGTLRPLGLVKEVIEAMSLDLTYAYDDLVFVEHNAFMFRFNETAASVELLFNKECPQEEVENLAPIIIAKGMERGLIVVNSGWYSLTQNEEDETISLQFY